MKKVKFDKDLIFGILLAEVIGLVITLILGLLALINWWLIYILCVSLLIPVCSAIVKKYRENPDEINDFMFRLFFGDYDDEDEDEDDNRII